MEEIKGNIIYLAKNGEFDIIVHGCNMQGVMGAGLALQIKKEIPEAYKAYLVDKPTYELGGYSSVKVEYNENKFTVLNLYTQVYTGRPLDRKDTAEIRYAAIETVFKKIDRDFKDKHIGIPQIGAGLARLDWGKIKEIIKNTVKNNEITIVLYDR
jgi:O-acetyl-ADP-ribose deacetylase (regulator of RNase III)